MTGLVAPGGATFRKSRRDAPAGFFACEAAGLRWLAVPGGPRVVGVLGIGEHHVDVTKITPARPDAAAAAEFGSRLAVLHDAGAPAWGCGPAGWSTDGFFGPLDDPLPMVTGSWDTWAGFYAEARLRPIAEQGVARGALDRSDAAALVALCSRLPRLIGPAGDDVPARVHGDLWSGNVMWSRRPGAVPGVEAVLIDPAAHGGHRECDLAMLALFGAAHLDRILAGYQQVHPLARGWQHRVALHQVYPVAVHAVLFGGGYRSQLRGLLARLT